MEQTTTNIMKTIKIIFYLVLIALFAGIIAWKLIKSDFVFDFSKFDFSDFLALILSLFSVGLSVLFYFKATDTSNLFYDNTYKFTKDISVILGRIEAGFGERLKHLDEGYSGLHDKFIAGQLKSPQVTVEKAEKEIESEKKKLESEIRERDKILENVMMKAKIQDKERDNILKSIREKDETIINLSKELQLLRRRIESTELTRVEELPEMSPKIHDLLRNLISHYIGAENIGKMSKDLLNRRVKSFFEELNESSLHELRINGIINSERKLTEKGFEFIDVLSKRYYR